MHWSIVLQFDPLTLNVLVHRYQLSRDQTLPNFSDIERSAAEIILSQLGSEWVKCLTRTKNAPCGCSNFSSCCSILKPKCDKGNRGRESRPKFRTFWSTIKFSRGVNEMTWVNSTSSVQDQTSDKPLSTVWKISGVNEWNEMNESAVK